LGAPKTIKEGIIKLVDVKGLIESLKKVIPNHEKDAPSCRTEAIALQQWFKENETSFSIIDDKN
jgi:hypothetical protein